MIVVYRYTNTVRTPWTPEDYSVFLAGLSHSWCVHNGHHQFHVVNQHSVEQTLIPVLQRLQVYVAVKVIAAFVEVGHRTYHLLVLVADGCRNQTMDAHQLAFFQGEGRSLEK